MKQKESFMDKSTFFSVFLVLMAWLAWNSYMKKKYPPGAAKPLPPIQNQQFNKPSSPALPPPSPRAAGQPKPKLKSDLFYDHPALSFQVSPVGMGLKNIKLKQILDRKNQPVVLSSPHLDWNTFETRLLGKEADPLYFKMNRKNHVFKGTAVFKKTVIVKTLEVFPKKYHIKAQIKVRGDLTRLNGLSVFIPPFLVDAAAKKGFFSFFSQPDFLSFFSWSSSSGLERTPLVSEDIAALSARPPLPFVQLAAAGTKYFGTALIDQSDISGQFYFLSQNQKLYGVLGHKIFNKKQDFLLSYSLFLGPKSLSLLSGHHPHLKDWVDFGWFGSLARMILKILRFFYSLAGNWGVSIILLTLLVRFSLLPLVLSSHRSMEVMKVIQPEIKKIREKFKKDPQRMNQEVMALMKAHKANPLGGCLPMLLQIPVFWALWKALGSSYSLYRSPFVFWIQDLSWKDPFYVLPVLIGGLMFLQQKLSPAALSREMARAMQILPVFITLFMVNLPSGLTLYVLISSLFGILQQIYLNKASQPPQRTR